MIIWVHEAVRIISLTRPHISPSIARTQYAITRLLLEKLKAAHLAAAQLWRQM